MKRLVLFVSCVVLWCLLVWPVDPVSGRIQVQDVVAGLVAALVVTLVMRDVGTQNFQHWINPVRIFWLVVYIFVFAYYVIKANLDVAYRVLHPAMPIRPGIVEVKTNLKTAVAITVLANSITLTPGTLTVDVTEDGRLYVHWINVQTTKIEEATENIVKRFEWFIKKILE